MSEILSYALWGGVVWAAFTFWSWLCYRYGRYVQNGYTHPGGLADE